jgi:hypothetical protein
MVIQKEKEKNKKMMEKRRKNKLKMDQTHKLVNIKMLETKNKKRNLVKNIKITDYLNL